MPSRAIGLAIGMPGSVTSAFSEQEDFEAALHAEGCLGLLITSRGQFRAQLTQIALHRLHLSAAEEHLSRIAFVAVPADTVLMSFAIGTALSPIWGGIAAQTGEIVTLGPGQRIHARTEGVSRWGMIRLPVEDLTRYGRALTGAPFAVSSGARCWRPPAAAGRELRQLHAAAIRVAQARPQALVERRGRAWTGATIDPCAGQLPVGGVGGRGYTGQAAAPGHYGPLRGSASDPA